MTLQVSGEDMSKTLSPNTHLISTSHYLRASNILEMSEKCLLSQLSCVSCVDICRGRVVFHKIRGVSSPDGHHVRSTNRSRPLCYQRHPAHHDPSVRHAKYVFIASVATEMAVEMRFFKPLCQFLCFILSFNNTFLCLQHAC